MKSICELQFSDVNEVWAGMRNSSQYVDKNLTHELKHLVVFTQNIFPIKLKLFNYVVASHYSKNN